MSLLHGMAAALIRYETLSSKQIKAVMRGEPLVDPSRDGDRDVDASGASPGHAAPLGALGSALIRRAYR